MGRPSKLTDKQWDDVARRHLAGETIRGLAKELKIGASNVSAHVSKRVQTQKDVANQIIAADSALKALPISEQIAVCALVDDLKAISSHLASAGKYGSMTAHRLSAIAHKHTDLIDETAGLTAENTEALKSVMALTKAANDSSQIGLNLLAANKDMLKDTGDNAIKIHGGLPDA